MVSASGKKHFFDMHVQQAQDLTLPVACICIMQGGEGHLVPVRLVFLDLEQLRRMQNFTRHELLELERPSLPDFLNAWLTCSRIFAYLGCAPRSVLQACRLSRAATLAVLHMPTSLNSICWKPSFSVCRSVCFCS